MNTSIILILIIFVLLYESMAFAQKPNIFFILADGRSTKGAIQNNDGPKIWSQLSWMTKVKKQ